MRYDPSLWVALQFVFHRFFNRLQWHFHAIEGKLGSLRHQVRENRRMGSFGVASGDFANRFIDIVDVQAFVIMLRPEFQACLALRAPEKISAGTRGSG